MVPRIETGIAGTATVLSLFGTMVYASVEPYNQPGLDTRNGCQFIGRTYEPTAIGKEIWEQVSGPRPNYFRAFAVSLMERQMSLDSEIAAIIYDNIGSLLD